jgi:hypothetical protein
MGYHVPFLLGDPRPRTDTFRSYSPVQTEDQFRAKIHALFPTATTAQITAYLNLNFPLAMNEQDFAWFMRVRYWTIDGAIHLSSSVYGGITFSFNGTYPPRHPPPTPAQEYDGTGASAQGWNLVTDRGSGDHTGWPDNPFGGGSPDTQRDDFFYLTQERYMIGQNRWLMCWPGNQVTVFIGDPTVSMDTEQFDYFSGSNPPSGPPWTQTMSAMYVDSRTGDSGWGPSSLLRVTLIFGPQFFSNKSPTSLTLGPTFPSVYVDADGDYHPFFVFEFYSGGDTFATPLYLKNRLAPLPANSVNCTVRVEFNATQSSLVDAMVVGASSTIGTLTLTSSTVKIKPQEFWPYNDVYDTTTGVGDPF